VGRRVNREWDTPANSLESLVAEASQCCAHVRRGSACTRSAVAWRSGLPLIEAVGKTDAYLSIVLDEARALESSTIVIVRSRTGS